MPNSHPHIKLPSQLVTRDVALNLTNNPFPQKLPEYDVASQKERLLTNINKIKDFSSNKEGHLKLQNDKKFSEIKVEFYSKTPKEFIQRYGINVYEYQNGSLIGNISSRKMPGERKSQFDKLEEDIRSYNNSWRLKSYFKKIKNIEPVSLEELMTPSLKDLLQWGNNNVMVDVCFEGSKIDISEKIALIKEEKPDKYISSINTDLVHFCRLSSNIDELNELTSSFSWIDRIIQSPAYDFDQSGISVDWEEIETVAPQENIEPVLVFEQSWINLDHIFIENAATSENPTSADMTHGTAVCSLVICGDKMSPRGNITQDNRVVHILLPSGAHNVEQTIKDAIAHFSQEYNMVIANLSLNNYWNQFYNRTSIDNLTLLLDEFSNKYNCLFVVSAWNLFSKDTWNQQMTNECIRLWYPNYFNLDYVNILPPSDSINNLCVGSESGIVSGNSFAQLWYPAPHTRKNIPNNVFKKPDLVHKDGNYCINADGRLEEQRSLIYSADASNPNHLMNSIWTSFTAPLITYLAWLIHNKYIDYSNNTVKWLLIHFAEHTEAMGLDEILKNNLLWFWIPNIEKIVSSFDESASIIIEDEIWMNKEKTVKIPIPSSLLHKSRLRLSLRRTLVYNPIVNTHYPEKYNSITITTEIFKWGERGNGWTYSVWRGSDAAEKSNVKRYPVEKFATKNFSDRLWEIKVKCECDADFLNYLPDGYKQKFSIILTVEDVVEDSWVNIYEEMSLLIDNEVNNIVNVGV